MAKNGEQWFDEKRFSRFENNNYFWWKAPWGKSVSMHRYVWEHYNGPIPEGHVVHHKDHDCANNHIENLMLMEDKAHRQHHMDIRKANGTAPTFGEKCREKAAEWHRSPEGLAWHAENGRKVWADKEPETHKCVECGKEYTAVKSAVKKGYCNQSCQQRVRRRSGVDNVLRNCVLCDAEFTASKYSKQASCSRKCGTTISARKRLAAKKAREEAKSEKPGGRVEDTAALGKLYTDGAQAGQGTEGQQGDIERGGATSQDPCVSPPPE